MHNPECGLSRGLRDRSTIIRLVRENRLTPSRKLPGATGAYLFWRHDVLRLVGEVTTNKPPVDAA